MGVIIQTFGEYMSDVISYFAKISGTPAERAVSYGRRQAAFIQAGFDKGHSVRTTAQVLDVMYYGNKRMNAARYSGKPR